MACMQRVRLWLSIAVCSFSLFLPAARAAESLADLRQQARQLERDGDWAKACSFYAYILTKDRTLTDVRERFQTCLRHCHRVRRHQDSSYRQQVLNQDAPVALQVYGEVLEQLHREYFENDKADLNRLFHQGLHELRLALNDDSFRRDYLASVKKEAVESFLTKLADFGSREIRTPLDAQNQAMKVALAAKKSLGLKPTVTVLEIACGACNALDEHSYYLTPRQFSDDHAALRGDIVGVGIDLTLTDGRLLVSQVYINSPAARAGLVVGDRVLTIDGEPAEELTLETALEMLKGEAGTVISLEIAVPQGIESRLSMKSRSFTLVRQPINVSIALQRMLEPAIGYIQLAAFHEHTLAELDEAIRQLEGQGMKALVLDLRGNSGGLLESAVQVAERFLWEGAYIVNTRGRLREAKRTSRNLHPLLTPLVVVIDGSTASAAEILAGALKENLSETGQPRATLVGQTSFGKGTVQHMVELKTVQAGGLRITWARFYSPLNHPYNSIGVEPHFIVEPTTMAFDEQLREAVMRAELLAKQLVMMPR